MQSKPMITKFCLKCGVMAPMAGQPVCARCAECIDAGDLTAAHMLRAPEVAQITGLGGNQIRELMADYGFNVRGRLYIKTESLDELRRSGRIGKYLSLSKWGKQIHAYAIKDRLTPHDVAQALNCDEKTAMGFIREFGEFDKGVWRINRNKFALLRVEGWAAEWMKEHATKVNG